MSELCLDCFNKIMETNEPKRKFILSPGCDLCEACGQYKPVVIRMKWRYILMEEFSDTAARYRKNRPSRK